MFVHCSWLVVFSCSDTQIISIQSPHNLNHRFVNGTMNLSGRELSPGWFAIQRTAAFESGQEAAKDSIAKFPYM